MEFKESELYYIEDYLFKEDSFEEIADFDVFE
jgi:hypothetical protein